MSNRLKAIECYDRAMALGADRSDPKNANLAWQFLCSSTTMDPTYAKGWWDLGCAAANSGKLQAACAAWRKVVNLPVGTEPGDATPELHLMALVNLSNRTHHLGRNEESRECIKAILEIDELNPHGLINLSIVESVEGKHLDALHHAKHAHRIDPNNAAGQVALAFAHMYVGQYAEGLKHFEGRFPYRLQTFEQYPMPKWQGEDGKRVWIVAEQGIGDTLSFARFVPQAAARSDHLMLQVQPELYRLFRMMFADLANVEVVPLPPHGMPAVDYWSTFVSLPTALGLTDREIIEDELPKVPRRLKGGGGGFSLAMSATWKDQTAKFHVGVAWCGNPKSDNNVWKSFPLVHLLDLYKVPGVALYSLQVGERAKDIHDAGASSLIRDLTPYITDVVDTMALLRDLDLVVTVESALGHICSAVGRECWIPYSYMGRDYRIGHDGTRRLWTPHHRIFKQGRDMAWQPVFDDIVAALSMKVNHG